MFTGVYMAFDLDVAIVGAGPAGAAAAILLARQGYHVGLIDKATFPRDKTCAECMSPAIEGILDRLGVLEQVEAEHPAHLLGFDIYSPGGFVCRSDYGGIPASDGTYHKHALALPRYLFDHLLVERARSEGVKMFEGTRLQEYQIEGAGSRQVAVSATVQTAQPTLVARPTADSPSTSDASTGERKAPISSATLRARLLVAADGVHSLIARRLGAHRPSTRHRKIALVTHMRGIRDLGVYGELHVGRGSYAGLAPLEPPEIGDLCNVSIVVDEQESKRLAGRVEAFFDESLQTFPALAPRLGEARRTKGMLTISRLAVSAHRISDDGVMLVGDATGFYDPFTGEGIYRALRGAELLADVAGAALAAGDCSAARLSAYDRLHRHEFAGKRLVEHIVQGMVARPWLSDRVASRLARRKRLADTMISVTGDFLPPSRVLSPFFMARLVL
jgi:flavin-dependent dehydrogenase